MCFCAGTPAASQSQPQQQAQSIKEAPLRKAASLNAMRKKAQGDVSPADPAKERTGDAPATSSSAPKVHICCYFATM